MSATQSIEQQRGSWTYIVPVSNVMLTDAVNWEFTIKGVTLVAAHRLPHRRKRLGIPKPLSELTHHHGGILKRFFKGIDTFAIVRHSGRPKDHKKVLLSLIRDELAILSLSQLGYSKRRNHTNPSISHERPTAKRSYFLIESQRSSWSQQHQLVGPFGSLTLDARWHEFQKKVFFRKLLKVINSKHSVDKGWREDLRRAAILAGMSQTSVDVAQAFLWNMIVLELLLTEQGDKVGDTLPSRCEAFIGWTLDWQSKNFDRRIRDVYSKRCLLVHQGKRDAVTGRDLFFTDDLILNLLTNIVAHPTLFSSKADVIAFSNKVEACKLLGRKLSVQPRSLRFLSRRYSAKDYEER